jgi:hypothetical protein
MFGVVTMIRDLEIKMVQFAHLLGTYVKKVVRDRIVIVLDRCKYLKQRVKKLTSAQQSATRKPLGQYIIEKALSDGKNVVIPALEAEISPAQMEEIDGVACSVTDYSEEMEKYRSQIEK